MIKHGDYRTGTTIEKKASGFDEAGQSIEGGWTQHGQAYADLRFSAGQTVIKSDAPLNETRASIRYPFRLDITPGMRILAEGYIFDIRAVLPDLQKREFVDCACVAGVNSG